MRPLVIDSFADGKALAPLVLTHIVLPTKIGGETHSGCNRRAHISARLIPGNADIGVKPLFRRKNYVNTLDKLPVGKLLDFFEYHIFDFRDSFDFAAHRYLHLVVQTTTATPLQAAPSSSAEQRR